MRRPPLRGVALLDRTGGRMRSRPIRRPVLAAPTACRAESLEGRVLLSASLLRDLNTNGLGSAPQEFTDVNGTLFFSAEGPAGRELYRSDGAVAPLVKDIRPGIAGSTPQTLFNHGGTLFFTADDGAH